MPVPGEFDNDLYREEVERARRMSAEEKFLAGEELFEFASGITKAGIRDQHPAATDEEVDRLFAERLRLGERIEALERLRFLEGRSREN